tara:strand:- start:470 stop:919 length:450 start_codon:yes stop_codon:yes gene_type:complete
MPDESYTDYNPATKAEKDKYDKILKDKGYKRGAEYAQLFTPEPEDEDYKRGSIFRYFARQANSRTATITEIDKEQYESWHKPDSGLDKQFYIVSIVKWRVSGPLQGYTADDGTYRKGVLEGNQDSVLLAEETMPGISLQLQDYIKFWKR